jgi:hypothetical protein
MTSRSTTPPPCLGFLTVVENADLGVLGGYLLLNAAGRPLEFHCTAPIRANRTQEILYGPTLRPFLYGEQIGQTLLTKSKLTPIVICTDSEPVLATREFSDVPVVQVLSDRSGATAGSPNSASGSQFKLALNHVVTAANQSSDEQAIRAAWPPLADHLNLLEPFERIREALEEAQRSSRQAA